MKILETVRSSWASEQTRCAENRLRQPSYCGVQRMRFYRVKQLVFGTLIILLAPLAHSSDGEELSGKKGERTPSSIVVYKTIGDTELKLHVFYPEDHKASDNRPAIVFFFGGAWNGGSPTQFYPHSEHLASRGMVAIAAEYRVKSRNKTSPKECLKDGKSAIRWVRQHAGQLGVDAKQVLAGGGSAGGHVAAATATTTGFEEDGEDLSVSSRPVALVLFNPVFDNGPKGWGHKRVKEYWEEFSPMHNISEKAPPTVVFLGTKDKLIPVSTAEEYKRRMNEHGRRCDLHLYEDRTHGFFNLSKGREDYDSTVRQMDQFLVSLGYLEEKDGK